MPNPLDHPTMRLLTLPIREPLPGNALPPLASDHDAAENARRYRAVVLTTMRQLRGLTQTRLRLAPQPGEAAEALRFWLLPRLADKWQMTAEVFHTDGWEIDFGGSPDGYQVLAHGELLCPFLGARWVHTAWLGIERGCHCVTGLTADGGEYFRAWPACPTGVLEERPLPTLPVIRSDRHWRDALSSPLGPALKRAWQQEC